MTVSWTTWLLLFPHALCSLIHEEVNPEHTVVVFGFSGLPWDAMSTHHLPALQHMKEHGVHVKQKYDPFQTETLPSFVTMVTGKYPDSHGMVSNKMKDLRNNYQFTANMDDPQWWSRVNPIWIRNQKTSNKSALCYWPGHNIGFNGRKSEYSCDDSTYSDPFRLLTVNGEIAKEVMPLHDRVERVKHWLTLSNRTRPTLIAVYFEEPFQTILKHGSHSNETRKAFQLVNNVTQNMLDFLHAKNLEERINFIVTGESGAVDISEDGDIFLDDYLARTEFASSYEIIDNGPITTINPTFKDPAKIKKLISILQTSNSAMTVYDGRKLPRRLHFTAKDRTMPIIAVANKSHRINKDRTTVPPNKAMMGYHGMYPSTHSLLLAKGPAFKEAHTIDSIPNVDVYNILCKTLQIDHGEENCNGSVRDISSMFRKPKKWYVVVYRKVVKSATRIVIAAIIALVLLFVAVYLIVFSVYKTWTRCRWGPDGMRTVEVNPPMKFPKPTFRNIVTEPQEKEAKLHLLNDSEVSDLEEDLHFQYHNEADDSVRN